MKKSSKRIIIYAIVITAAIILYSLEKRRVTDVVKDPFYTDTSDTSKADNSKKQEFIENTPAATNPEPISSDQITLTAEQSGNKITVLTKLANLPGGVCKLTITNGNVSVLKQADVIYQPQFSSCAGFTIPIAEVGGGNWSIKLAVTHESTSLEKTITVEVSP